ncbi:MAG TPA: hypothetical protein VLM79_27845 [Kofleriaceae bacterium]|nr:hypothetical protein [Kofleriaceae bacterium]
MDVLDAPIGMREHERRRLGFGDHSGAARKLSDPRGIGFARSKQLAVRLCEHPIGRKREALERRRALDQQLHLVDEPACEHRTRRRVRGREIRLDRREPGAEWTRAHERLRAWKARRMQRALRCCDRFERCAIERQIWVGRGRRLCFDDDLAAIVEHDAVDAADTHRRRGRPLGSLAAGWSPDRQAEGDDRAKLRVPVGVDVGAAASRCRRVSRVSTRSASGSTEISSPSVSLPSSWVTTIQPPSERCSASSSVGRPAQRSVTLRRYIGTEDQRSGA